MLGWARHLLGQDVPALADARSARRWLTELPANDAMKALTELARGLTEVRTHETIRLADRLDVILLLDEASIGHRNRLAREYLSQSRLPSYRENALWFSIHQFWNALAGAYISCLDQAQAEKGSHLAPDRLLLFLLRGLHAGRHWLKWRFLRYSLIEAGQWRSVARFLVVAENNKLGSSSQAMYGGTPTQTSPQNELLRLLLLGVSATDSLMPVQTEIASRLIDGVIPHCDWTREQSAQMAFCYDLIGERPPMRIQGAPPDSGHWRFFSGVRALEQLERIRSEAERGILSTGLHLGGDYPLIQVAAVAEHLLRYWTHPAPERRSERISSYQRIEVVHGFSQVVRHFIRMSHQGSPENAASIATKEEVIEISAPDSLAGAAEIADPLYTSANDTAGGLESWVVQNVSTTGLGAIVPQVSGDWLQVGQLLALAFVEPVSGWKLAVVRRLHQTAQGQVYVGLEILAQQAEAARISLPGMVLQDEEFALVLDNAGRTELKLLTRVGTLGANSTAHIEYNGRFAIRTRCCLEKNGSFDLALVTKISEEAMEKPC